MNGGDHKQRLAAILAADAAGYSRLMAGDDRATVAALDAARAVFRGQIESNQGRVIDMAGDSVLAVFETATGAVAAALAVQQALEFSMAGVPDERRMRFRIGVHLGDVIEKADGTVYGDGVNIAARLEGLAEPGGITVSESIRTAVKGKVAARFDDQGEQAVKNIPEPVRTFAVRAEGIAPGQGVPAATAAATDNRYPPVGEIDPSLPDKPSIAVLPFTNMSGDPEQEYFTDGITEDIITELSRFHSLFVIARNSAFSYKGQAVDERTVARELGVRYVLAGSIRRAGNRIRVTAQLIDAQSGNHIWAEKYDRVLEDIFAVQEEVTQAIVAAIAPHIETSEAKRARGVRPGNLSAYELAMRGWSTAWVAFCEADKGARDEALQFAREALALDSRCSAALRTIAFAQWQHISLNTTSSVSETLDDGIGAARLAIAIDNGDHIAHLWKGCLLYYAGQQETGLADVRRAHELNPNDPLTLANLGFVEGLSGNQQKGVQYATEALRLSPRDPTRYFFHNLLAWVYFSAGDYAKGVDSAQRSIREAPNFPAPYLSLVLNLIGSAEIVRGKSEFQALRKLAPEMLEARLAGEWSASSPEWRQRATAFLRIAAGLEYPGAPDSQAVRYIP